MMTLFPIRGGARRPLKRQSLHQRRRLRTVRRILTAIAAAVLLMGAMTGLTDDTTTPVIVTARSIEAGSVLSATDLATRNISTDSALGGVFPDAKALIGRIITVDAKSGDVLSQSMITSVTAPSHYSTIDVPIIGEPQGNPIGRHVSLATDGECSSSKRASDGLCVISSDSVILSAPREVDGTTMLLCAMSGADALSVSRAVQESPVVVVMNAD